MNQGNYYGVKIKTEIFDKEHRYYGGIIYPSDFNPDCRKDNINGSQIASRIERDIKPIRTAAVRKNMRHK